MFDDEFDDFDEVVRKKRFGTKSDTEWYDNYFIYGRNKDDENQIKNTELAQQTLDWLHQQFGRYICMNYSIPRDRTHFPYKYEVLNILQRFRQENKEAEKWILNAYNLNLGEINPFKFFDHSIALEKCIITNPYIDYTKLPNIRSNNDFYIMKLNENLYNTKCHSFVIFFKEDYPSFATTPIPCGWTFM